jgi:hypothetical protein
LNQQTRIILTYCLAVLTWTFKARLKTRYVVWTLISFEDSHVAFWLPYRFFMREYLAGEIPAKVGILWHGD